MAVVTCPKCGAKNRVESPKPGLTPVCGRCKTTLTGVGGAPAEPLVISDATFDREVLQAGGMPVLVDYWAPWCGPCRLIGPIVEQLAAESGGRYKIAKLNIDENPRTAAQYRVESIPTLMIFKNGSVVDRLVGAQPKKTIAARLNAVA